MQNQNRLRDYFNQSSFSNLEIFKIFYQFLKNFENQYQYDEYLGLFQESLQHKNGYGCFKQLIIEFNLSTYLTLYVKDLIHKKMNTLEQNSKEKIYFQNTLLIQILGQKFLS
ncbi:unnamed protein product [Paramecium sonneborni]|uniref:Uncharacterized protein n=1 Tax=Paramecium sonneborni TaxID=65129 RepID=A0A8S1NVU2_9CILI|nr:unnamed protein product [Paramecium sonneborni]